MSGELCLLNHQQTRAIDLRLLRRVIRQLLTSLAATDFDLTIHLVNADTMARLNATHLQHAGSTDVITLDYADAAQSDVAKVLTGELFVCVDEALLQARKFRVTWQLELTRYIVHGVLHLQGHDDLQPAPRRRMKLEENRRVRELTRDFSLSKLLRKTGTKS